MLQQTQQIENTEVIDIFKALDNEISVRMFNLISREGGWSVNGDIKKIAGTTKRYYSRITKLMQAGLVRRKSGVYSLTALGKIMLATQLSMVAACNELRMLRVVDSIESEKMPREEYENIVNRLIVNEKLRGMLLLL